MYYIWHKLPPKHRPYKHARGICISPYVGPFSYGELNHCDRLHILITFIYIITPLLTYTHKPVLARASSSNMLKLNDDKTDVILFTSKYALKSHQNVAVTVGEQPVRPVRPATSIYNMGVVYDKPLSMIQHVNSVCRDTRMSVTSAASGGTWQRMLR